jgi:hypothetical protein
VKSLLILTLIARLTKSDHRKESSANFSTQDSHQNLSVLLYYQDVACNITINRQPAGHALVKNEIDIGLIKANRLHLIECKTKRFEQGADVLYKLDSLRDLMGGLQSRTMLVSFNNLDKISRARAKELDIQLCCHTELRNLQHHLQLWLINER